MTIRQNTAWGLRPARWIFVLCVIHAACVVADTHAQPGNTPARQLKFTHLTTNDGLSQGYVTAILQDRRGFMWFATRDGLNRYDGNAFVVYDREFFRLRIRDDGRGIDRKVLEAGARQGHWGLPGVRERAERIGARLKLWSELGAGTEVELTVPARIAYETVHRSRGLWLFRKTKVHS